MGNSLTPRLTGARPVELLSVEFASVEKRFPDLVSRLEDGRIFHLEVQSTNDPRMPQRMLHYRTLIRARFEGVRMLQHVLYIGGPPLLMETYIEEEDLSYRFHLSDIREIDEEVLLRSESEAERMLAVLSRTRDDRATIRRILGSWARAPRRERDDLIEKLMLLSGLRRLDSAVAEEVRNMAFTLDYMENDFFRGLIEERVEKGIQQALENGQATMISKLLTKRFGVLAPDIEQKLTSAHSEQLERWALRLLDASTLDEVFSD